MLKIFKDLSLTGGVLLFSAFFLGFLFRLTGVFELSAWGDEVATFYYSSHLSEIFPYAAHTPFPFILNFLWMSVFPDTIVSLRLFYILLNFLFSVTSSLLFARIYGKFKGALLFSLWWLWPTLIIFSRQARHYALFADATLFLLIYWQIKDRFPVLLTWVFLALYQLIHPLASIPVFLLIGFDLFWKKVSFKRSLILFTSFLPLFFYYSFKFLVEGKGTAMSKIAWIGTKFQDFYPSLWLLVGGDSFPFNNFFPVNPIYTFVLILFIGGTLLLKKNKEALWYETLFKSVFVIMGTFVTIEILSLLGLNLRINRYFIFLIPFLLFPLLAQRDQWSLKSFKIRSSLIISGLVFYNLFIFKPWSLYPGDAEVVSSFKSFLSQLPKKFLVVCASRYELHYYFNRPYSDCSELAIGLNRMKQDFYFFDLHDNDKDKYIPAYIMNEAEVEISEKFINASFYSFVYPKGIQK